MERCLLISACYETVATPGGILSVSGNTRTEYAFVGDHLGNVRAVVDMTAGAVVERNDYYPYGTRITVAIDSTSTSYPSLAANRWRHQGKEWQSSITGLFYSDFGARLYDPYTGSWLGPDPLATSYPGISPYVFCAANPINYVDPDGNRIRIYDEDNSEYLYYANGKFHHEDGSEYCGDNSFVQAVQTSLQQLLSLNDSYINEIVAYLELSPLDHTFVHYVGTRDFVRPVGEYGNSFANEGRPLSTWVYLALNNRVIDNVPNTNTTTIAHELMHSYDYDNGNYRGIRPWNDSSSNIDPSEIRAVNFENRARARLHMELRRNYSGVEIRNNDFENPWKRKQLIY